MPASTSPRSTDPRLLLLDVRRPDSEPVIDHSDAMVPGGAMTYRLLAGGESEMLR